MLMDLPSCQQSGGKVQLGARDLHFIFLDRGQRFDLDFFRLAKVTLHYDTVWVETQDYIYVFHSAAFSWDLGTTKQNMESIVALTFFKFDT